MHLGTTSGQVGKYVFLFGSMERVTLITERSDNPAEIAHKRKFPTYTGALEGVLVTVTGTGTGGPSTCIVIEELHSYGAHTMIRVGSAASTSRKVEIGDAVIPNGVVHMEGTGNRYFPFEFPAVPDFEMLKALKTAVLRLGYPYNVEITITEDSYYTGAESEAESVYEGLKYKWDSYVRGGATSTSMECAVLFLIDTSLGTRTFSVMISATNLGKYSNDAVDCPDRQEQRVAKVGIKAMRQIIPQDKEKGTTM